MGVLAKGVCPKCHRFTDFKYAEINGKVYWICKNCGHEIADDGPEQITWGGI